MLRDRLIIGAIGTVVAVAVLLLGETVLGVIVSVLALIALTEMFSALGFFKKNIPLAVIGYIAGVGILLLNIMVAGGSINYWLLTPLGFELLIIFMIVLFVYMVLAHNKTTFTDVTTCMFTTFYITQFFSCLTLIRYGTHGELMIWVPLVIAWLSDTMAYTFGRLFGKHKLIPEVSPKKTVEGAVGGVLGGIVFMCVFGLVCANFFDKHVNWLNIIILGGVGSVLSQFGDLAASWIKREQGVKDYGSILPGHGGIMDRFDSVLVVAPFVYFTAALLPIFI